MGSKRSDSSDLQFNSALASKIDIHSLENVDN